MGGWRNFWGHELKLDPVGGVKISFRPLLGGHKNRCQTFLGDRDKR